MINDEIMFGTNDSKLRENMLLEKYLAFLKAEELCKVAESMTQRKEIKNATENHVDAVFEARDIAKRKWG